MEVSKPSTYKSILFTCKALECGHGDDFSALFTIREVPSFGFCIESVDLIMDRDGDKVCVGAVGGEIMMRADSLPDGTPDLERLCRDWIGAWNREFRNGCEDSVLGLFLIIKQTIAQGKIDIA